MALKKSDLRAIIKNEDATSEEKLTEILNILHDEVDSIKDERDEIAGQLKTANEEIGTLKNNATANDGEWQKKYEDEHKAFEDYKTEQANAEIRTGKENAYKSLLKEIGINDKIAELLISKADLDAISVEDGKITNAEELTAKYKEDYKDYIPTTTATGATTVTPPAGGETKVDLDKLSMAEYIKARKAK